MSTEDESHDCLDGESLEEARARRSQWPVRKGKLGDLEMEAELVATTPAERIAMVWPITVQALAFRGVNVAESRLSRHVVCVTRRTG